MASRTPSNLFSTQILESRYYWQSRYNKSNPLEVVCAGWESCRPDYVVSRQNFPWWAVELVVKGEGWLTILDQRFRLRTGSVFCYGPNIPLKIETDPANPLQKYFVDFTGTDVRRSPGPVQPGQVRQALYPHELREIIDRMIVEGTRRSPYAREIANNYMRLLLQKLNECAPGQAGPGTSRALDSYLKAKALLDESYHDLNTIEDAAERLGLTPETLCRHFRRFSNISPYQYLLQLKMNRAVELLLGSHLMIKEVGQTVGFEDAFHFSRTFKRLQGTSPEIFRRLHKRSDQ